MIDTPLERTKLVQALQINRGISLSEEIGEYYLGAHNIEEDYLIVYLDINLDTIFLINLDSTPRFPIRAKYSEIYAAIDDGKLEIVTIEWPGKALLAFEDLNEKSKSKANARYDVVAPLLVDLEATLMNNYGENRFQVVIDDTGKSKQYVYDCFIGYLYYGQRRSGLALPIGKNIFHVPKEKREIYVKQGRPNTYLPRGKVLDEYDYKNFEKAKRLYLKRNGPTLIRVYEMMLAKHYYASRIKTDRNGRRKTNQQYRIVLKPETECPTFSQFYYWLHTSYGDLLARRDKSRKNPIEFSKDLAGRTGDAYQTIIAFGQVFELDETPFDEELVSVFDPNRRTKIGKPTLYFIIDTFSKYIVGLYITTENPSFKAVRQALFISGMNKAKLIEQYGLDPNVITWIYYGIPTGFFVDSAEFKNMISEGAVCDLQTSIKFARVGHGDDKPNVEQLFRLFSQYFEGLSKGHQTKSLTDIYNQLARRHASLTINELYVIAIVYINYHNNYRRIKNYSLDRAMIQDDVEPIPAKIVEWSLKYRPGYIIHYEPEELYMKLLAKDTVSVGRKGVYFARAGLWYNCEWLLIHGYQDQKTSRNKARVFDCRYNENFLDIILICTDDGLKIATLDSRCAAYSGLSLYEINLQKEAEKTKEASAENTQLGYKLGLLDFMGSVINNAQKERKTGPMPNISTIKDNRQLEAMVNRFSDTNQFLQALNQNAMLHFADADSTGESVEDEDKSRDAFNDDEE